MNKTQKVLFRLMEDFDKICSDNGLKYFIGGGTALGALRNGGFLAWDDDVDLFVTWETHLKLNEVMQNIDMPDRRWVSEEVTPYFWNPIARFYDLTTTDIVKDKLNDGTPNGHCLEIFTLDNYPNTVEEQKNYHKYLWLYAEINNPRYLSANLSMPEEMIDRDLYYYYRNMLETEGHDAAMADIFKHMTYPEDECDYYCARWSARPLVFRKDWVEEVRPIDFEGRTFPAATGIIRQMISNYNSDWNFVPKEKDRQVHPSLENTKMSYMEHSKEVKALCDKADYNTILHKTTIDRVERVFSQFELQKQLGEVRYHYMCALAEKMGEKSWDYSGVEQVDRRTEIGDTLFEYLTLCFTKSYKKFKYSVPMHDDLRDYIFYYLIYTNRRDDAAYFADLYPDCAAYERYSRINYCISEMKIAHYENKKDLAEEYVKELSEKWGLGRQREVERTKVWCLMQDKKTFSPDDIAEIQESLENPDDSEICKYLGDIACECGDILTAHKMYLKAYPGRNGILLTDMQNRGFYAGSAITKQTQKCLDLYNDFYEICKKLGIKFIAGNPVAGIADNKKFANFRYFPVFMKPKSMVKFVEYCEKNPGNTRDIEYYGNNTDYPFYTVRFVDKTTTDFDGSFPERFKKDGTYIEIFPLRGVKPDKLSTKYFIEKSQMMRDRYTKANVASGYSPAKYAVLENFSKYMNKAGSKGRRKIFMNFSNAYDAEGKQFWTLNNNVHFKKLPEKLLTETVEVTLFGKYKIIVPVNMKRYKKFLEDFNSNIGYSEDLIVDCDLGYEEVVSRIEDGDRIKAELKEIIADFDRNTIILNGQDKEINDAWAEITKLFK